VLGAEFHDALDELRHEPDRLLLAPSAAEISPRSLTDLATMAKRTHYSAIAIKCRDGEAPLLAEIAETCSIPFIRVSEHVSWRVFDALVARLLGERGHSDDTHFHRGAEPLFALANELAGFFGGSVAFEDLGRRVLAYSSVPDQLIDSLRTRGILNRLVPHSLFNDDQYRTVLRSEAPIKYPRLADEEPRVAFAIRAGALPLGTVWAIDASGNPDLTPEQDRRIRAAAEVAAGHMLDDIRLRSAGQMPREDRLRTLLTGQGVVGTELAELGISEERGAALLVFEAADGDHATTLAQLRLTVQRHLSLYREEAVTVAQSGRVYALFSGASAEFAESLAEPLLPILDRLIMPGTVVASPGAAHFAAGIAPLRELADRLLSTVKEHAVPQRILSVKKLRSLLMFERVSRLLAEQPELRSDAVAEMNESDPAVAETLLTWCGSFGNVAQTARSLGIHENTVRYRLRCAEERYRVDLSDPETLLVTWLQLRAQWFAERPDRRASDRSAASRPRRA
jgi:hypothetical protein